MPKYRVFAAHMQCFHTYIKAPSEKEALLIAEDLSPSDDKWIEENDGEYYWEVLLDHTEELEDEDYEIEEEVITELPLNPE